MQSTLGLMMCSRLVLD